MHTYQVEKFDETIITVKAHTEEEYLNELAVHGARVLFEVDNIRFMDSSDVNDKERYYLLNFDDDIFYELELKHFYELIGLYLVAEKGTLNLLKEEIRNIISGYKKIRLVGKNKNDN